MTKLQKRKDPVVPNLSTRNDFLRRLVAQRYLFLLMLPGIIYFIVFKYTPMYGAIIAFKDFNPRVGILESPWAGLKYFKQFFDSPFCWRLIRNTLLLSLYDLIFNFPVPIIFALLLNEVRCKRYKKAVQTISYLPHFISVVIVVGLMKTMFSPNGGVVNSLLSMFGVDPINFFSEKGWFRTLYVGSGIWQSFGWGSIIYLSALSSVDPQLYEAATVDGANRLQRVWHITLPSLKPVIAIQLIMCVGGMMSASFDLPWMLQNGLNLRTMETIATWNYKLSIGSNLGQYSYSTAVGMFQSIINLILIILANTASRKISETSFF